VVAAHGPGRSFARFAIGFLVSSIQSSLVTPTSGHELDDHAVLTLADPKQKLGQLSRELSEWKNLLH